MADIKLINGKYYDFDAFGNESFIITAKELKNVGIKNYYFMFRINNPRVATIDPFKKNITRQEAEALMHEFKYNMWSFIRMAVRMRTQKGVVPYGLHRGLAAALWNFERHQDFCLCEPRQTYKTTGLLAGPIQWAFQVSRDLKMHFFGKESGNTKDNLATLKDDIELLPEWLQFTRFMDKEGKIKKAHRATEKLKNNLLGNELFIHPSAASLSKAQSLGRGASGNILYYDEIEATLYFPEILSNSAPVYKTASENAIASGRPACRIFTCTPGNLDTKEGRDAYPVIQSMIPWTEKIYDMTEEQIEEYKSTYKDQYHEGSDGQSREVINVFYMEYQYFQIRKDHKWVMEQYALSGDRIAIRREILLQRLRGATESPISPEDIEYLISNMIKSTREILLCNKWIFKLYDHEAGLQRGIPKDLDENIPYLVGVDPAGGASGSKGDNFAVTIINPYNLKIAAEFKSPYMSGPNAIRMLKELIHDYIPKAVLVIEKNSMGIYLLQMLLETDLRDNVYWSKKAKELEEATEEYGADKELKEMSKQYKKYGIYTDKKKRAAMFELLLQHVNECKDILLSEYLVDDMCKLTKTSTGKIEAAKGEHDDCVMSYNIAIYMYYFGDNLPHFGIFPNPSTVLSYPIDTEENIIETNESQILALNNVASNEEEYMSYDEEVMQDCMREESQNRLLAETFSFIDDPIYSKRNNSNIVLPGTETINIEPWFFDSINNLV